MYMPVDICGIKVAALLDTGSNVNIISKSLFQRLPVQSKSCFVPSVGHQSVTLANGNSIDIVGTARIKVQTPCSNESHNIFVDILDHTSHPLILGTSYFMSKGVVLDFDKFTTFSGQMKGTKVRCKSNITIAPNSEILIYGKVDKSKMIGMPGFCSVHNALLHKGLMLGKNVCNISSDCTVPLKMLNPTNEAIFVHKGSILAHFKPLDNTYDITPVVIGEGTVQVGDSKVQCANIQVNDRVPSADFLNECQMNSELSMEDRMLLHECLVRNKSVFVTADNPNIGLTDVVEHKIHLKPGAVSKHHRPYRLPPDKKEVLRHQLNELVRQGIITQVHEDEDVPITSPIVLVAKRSKPKSHGEDVTKEQSLSWYRFCCDFRFLNSQTQEFRYNIPDLQELTESFTERTPNFITSIDLSKGFFQMPISSDSTRYTAFNTCYGTYKFLRLPMGLKTSPNSFQLLMDKVLRGLTFKSVLCYLDDVLICSETFQQHLDDLQSVFDRLKAAGLKLEPSKCNFAQRKCIFLGHEISREGIRPPSTKVELILDYAAPKSFKELRRIMGMFNWFRKFIPNYSAIAQPITRLMKKDTKFKWDTEQQTAFDELKRLLKESPVLSFPRYDIEFRLSVDTSSHGIGYMLYQIHEDGISRVVRFGSKGLSKWQRSYGPTKLELLGMVHAVLDCAPYLRGRHSVIECDHQALRPLFQKQLKGAIYERWLAILQQFDIEIIYKPAAEMCVADALSRNPKFPAVMESSPDEEDPHFPYVSEKTSVKLPNGDNLHSLLQTANNDTNVVQANFLKVAPCEYDADTEDNLAHLPLKQKRKRHRVLEPKQSSVQRPSEVKQIDMDLHSTATDATETDNCTRCDAQSNANQTTDENFTDRADYEASIVADESYTDRADYETSTVADVNNTDRAEYDVSTVADSDNSSQHDENADAGLFRNTQYLKTDIIQKQLNDYELSPLIKYLKDGTLPDSQKVARYILLKHSDYALIDGMLFHSRVAKSKRAKTFQNYQLVVPRDMIQNILHLYHDSPFAAHGGIQVTLDKIKEHYFFQRMSEIISEYVRSCESCQKRKITRVPTKSGISAYPTPNAPFEVWEMDLYGPLPISQSGNAYIFTAVDMFSKYMFAVPIREKDAITVASAFFRLVTTFGTCNTVISDMGSEFIAEVTSELCKMLHIQQQFTPAFMHHCLGACERTHGTLAERLTPYMTADRKNWESILPSVVFSINSSVNTSLGYSPFEIVYGTRPRFPLLNYQTEITTCKADVEKYLAEQLRKLNVVRAEIIDNVAKSKQKMIDSTNKDLKPLALQNGDYVFLQKQTTGKGQKLQEQYTGPYVIKHVISDHIVRLHDPTAAVNKEHDVHINRLKRAYVREPTPSKFFSVTSSRRVTHVHQSSQTEPNTCGDMPLRPPLRRSERSKQPPLRYRDNSHVNPITYMSTSSDSDGLHKVKKVIGQRHSPRGIQYLIHVVGEPADNAFWVHSSSLNAKARQSVLDRPPPFIH